MAARPVAIIASPILETPVQNTPIWSTLFTLYMSFCTSTYHRVTDIDERIFSVTLCLFVIYLHVKGKSRLADLSEACSGQSRLYWSRLCGCRYLLDTLLGR
uniref:Uncharacterized protein n=1 Tax=Cacopsylla melanoneura TaxID=428564 RepID=A0A8D8Z9J6_9HEMI